MYESLGIPYESKAVIFSDSLSVDKCIALQKQCDELGFKKGMCMCSCLIRHCIFFCALGMETN
jgi:hypothetical protein